jgi:hypothetical protein
MIGFDGSVGTSAIVNAQLGLATSARCPTDLVLGAIDGRRFYNNPASISNPGFPHDR